jgi:hypothetical protein
MCNVQPFSAAQPLTPPAKLNAPPRYFDNTPYRQMIGNV